VTGLIKTVLALKHKLIPPSPSRNPILRLILPVVPLRQYKAGGMEAGLTPRRAGVSSLGIGGTNAHVILEAPALQVSSPSRPWQLLVLSAKTDSALKPLQESG